jgi:hypothetical protein
MSDGLSKVNANAVSAETYSRLMEVVNQLADVSVENKKSSIHITHKRAFLGVHPRKDALLLNVVTVEPIDSARVRRMERVSANRFHNELLLTGPDDVDAELEGWITEAYASTL